MTFTDRKVIMQTTVNVVRLNTPPQMVFAVVVVKCNYKMKCFILKLKSFLKVNN